MKRFVAEADRGQWTLLPECLDDFIDENNPVRVIGSLLAPHRLQEVQPTGPLAHSCSRRSVHASSICRWRLIFDFALLLSTRVTENAHIEDAEQTSAVTGPVT
jgi:hypothetical protein